MNTLTEDEITRYSRQLILKGWSMKDQLRLKELSVEVPASLPSAALYLSALGVGHLYLCPGPEDRHAPKLCEHLAKFNPLHQVQIGCSENIDYRIVISGNRDLLQDDLAGDATLINISYLEDHISIDLLCNRIEQSHLKLALNKQLPPNLLAGTACCIVLLGHLFGPNLPSFSSSNSCLLP